MYMLKCWKVEINYIEEIIVVEEDLIIFDSEVGLFIQLEKEGFYEFLVLWLFLGEGFLSGVEDGRVV